MGKQGKTPDYQTLRKMEELYKSGMNVRDIVKQTGLSTSTIYKYHPSKKKQSIIINQTGEKNQDLDDIRREIDGLKSSIVSINETISDFYLEIKNIKETIETLKKHDTKETSSIKETIETKQNNDIETMKTKEIETIEIIEILPETSSDLFAPSVSPSGQEWFSKEEISKILKENGTPLDKTNIFREKNKLWIDTHPDAHKEQRKRDGYTDEHHNNKIKRWIEFHNANGKKKVKLIWLY